MGQEKIYKIYTKDGRVLTGPHYKNKQTLFEFFIGGGLTIFSQGNIDKIEDDNGMIITDFLKEFGY